MNTTKDILLNYAFMYLNYNKLKFVVFLAVVPVRHSCVTEYLNPLQI